MRTATVTRTATDAGGHSVTFSQTLQIDDAAPALLYDSLVDSLANWTLENGQANNTASYDKASNVTQDAAGAILIRGARETAPNGAAFTSGDALGRHITLPDAYVAEVVATLPYGQGIWPCPFWTRPKVGNDGEIDLMEQFGTTPYMKTTIHGPYAAPHPMVGRTRRWDTLPNPSQTAEHMWRLEKTLTAIRTYVDGLLIGEITRDQAIAAGINWDLIYGPGVTHYPRITLQLGCGVNNPGCASGMPPASFTSCVLKVSRIRIWA